MSIHRFAVLFALGVTLTSQAIADAATDRVKAGIAKHTEGKVIVAAVSATPVPGIYEVISGTNVFYSDASGRYAFIDGRLVDTGRRQDLTQATLQRISRIDFNRLPLDLAIKRVNGNGERQLAIFEDPACSACRDLHESLSQLDNVTIYLFPMPIISKESAHAVAATLCTAPSQRAMKWNQYMSLAEAIPTDAPEGCESAKGAVAKLIALSDQLGIHNTPTLVLGSGQRLVGRVPTEQLIGALDFPTIPDMQ